MKVILKKIFKNSESLKQLCSLSLLLFLSAACTSQKFNAPMKLGGKYISAKVLNHGYDVYMNNCMSCHGIKGDGLGPAAQGSMPLPRDFTQGLYKFSNVAGGELPRDEDLAHTIRYGLRGTPMLPWDLSDQQLNAVVQYIKTFSPAWEKGETGEAIPLSKDPWGPQLASQAIEQGKKIYHGLAQCYTCHPSYVSLKEINKASMDLTGNAVASLRPKIHLSTNLDSSYNTKVMPPDFTKNSIKTGGDLKSLYWLLGVGINGTAMPAWKGLLSPTGDEAESEKNQWALAYYVKHLHELKFDWEARKKFMRELNEKRRQFDRYEQ